MANSHTSIHIRVMTDSDIPIARDLLQQLGYSMSAEEVAQRFASVASATGHAVIIAEDGSVMVGLLHLFARLALEKPPEVIVQAIVVDQMYRGSGVGKKLMQAAEHWAESHGYGSVALTSNVLRTLSHAFYTAIGYRSVATSVMFRKELAAVNR